MKSVSRVIAARAPQTAGTRAIEVFESCDEVVFGLGQRGTDDALVVLRGVRADLEPVKLLDDKGGPMWSTIAQPRGKAMEYERTGAGAAPGVVDQAGQRQDPPSLFVLPLRTWVIAMGPARERARDAFLHPLDRPAPVRDDAALFFVRLDGPSLVAGVPRLRAKGGALEPIGRRLEWVTLALRPGSEGLVVTFQYAEDGAAAIAESLLRQVVDAVGAEGTEKTKWLGAAKITREAGTVVARLSLPPRLLEDLPTVSASELGF
jgi:hypothetical protein